MQVEEAKVPDTPNDNVNSVNSRRDGDGDCERVQGFDDTLVEVELDPINHTNEKVMVALLRAITRMLYLFGKGWEENLHVDASEGQEGK